MQCISVISTSCQLILIPPEPTTHFLSSFISSFTIIIDIANMESS